MEKIVVTKQNSLRRRYKLRKTGRQWLSWETTIPREVIAREAVKAGVPISEFQKQFEAEWLFDSFKGLHLLFVPREVATIRNKQAKIMEKEVKEKNAQKE